MAEILKQISNMGLVPVVVLEDAEKAVPVAKALQRGGIDCAEVTFRTAAAEASIRNITKECPEMLVGAGTVLSVEQVKSAVQAGAKFIVTPGYNPKVVNYCVEHHIPVVPGCMDTNAIEMALEAGLDTVKFFPAEAAGGVKMLKALAGPYTTLKFMPTGGVNQDNLKEYLAFRKVVACGGSWMVKGDLIANDRYDEIESRSREAIMQMLDFHVTHVGINCESEAEAEKNAASLDCLFGFARDPKNSSVFAGKSIEITKTKMPGSHGHIAIGVSDVERAVYYLSKKGVEFDLENAKYKGGRMSSVYLKKEIAGFAFHLVEDVR